MKNPIDWDCANGIVNDGLYSGFSKYLIETSHRQLSKFGNASVKSVERILEIGAGRGEHYRFVTNDFSEYLMTDISEWGRSEIEALAATDRRIKFEVQDMQKLSFEDESFDRVIVSCVLAHVDEPYVALSEVKRITKKGGTCSFFISADPGILLRLMRAVFTKPKMNALEVPYDLLNAISHRNSASGILEIAKYIFRNDDVSINYYPFHLRSWNMSTHIIFNVKVS